MSIGVSILGGTGYGAGELIRLLLSHPQVNIRNVVSSSLAGKRIADAHPHLLSLCKLSFDSEFSFEKLALDKFRVVFSALPHGTGSDMLKKILEEHGSEVIIIDLSGDFRLSDESIHGFHYPETAFLKDVRSKFVYGLTELFENQIADAQAISNPGCLASACILSVAPLSRLSTNTAGNIHFDAKTGTSGAGKGLKDTFHHPARHASFEAYKVLEHRHEPEIAQTLASIFGVQPTTMFVPHLLPVSRGIFVSAYFELEHEISQEQLTKEYEAFYEKAPFVRIRNSTPTLNDVVGSNFCDIAISVRGKQVVAMAALDNLIKGMAGQAIQNMNVMCGLEQTTGLWTAPLSLI